MTEFANAVNKAELLNALVAQKDHVLDLMNRAQDAGELQRAYGLFALLAPAWYAAGYGYKAREVRQKFHELAQATLVAEEAYLAACRKNCSTRRSTESNMVVLRALIEGTR